MNIYSIDPKALGALTSQQGVLLLRNLLWAEVSRASLPRHRVVISLDSSVKDGGIDAKVENAPALDSLLIKGNSFFQLKTGKTFKPWETSALRKELFGKSPKSISKTNLGAAVRRCLDSKGRYVLITLGHDLQPTEHSAALRALRQLLAQAGYRNANIEILGQGQIAGLLGRFPAISLELNKRSEFAFQNVQSWARNADMAVPVRLGSAQRDLVDELRKAVRSASYKHIRLIGEPGIGKSRLVLEAMSADDIAPTTIYVPHGEEFQQSQLFNELLRPDREFSAFLVVDDCDERDRASIWNALKLRPNLKLITVDHGPEDSTDTSMLVLHCPPLPDEQIAQIISSYIGTRSSLDNWAHWCSGSPRVAHAVADNLKRNPSDILKSPTNVPIWERFIVGYQRRTSREAEQHTTVLRHLSLFSKFGFEPPVDSEARFIADWIREADPSVTWSKFQAIVTHYKNRRILQGRHTLFIVPKALHVYLWRAFWDEFGRGFDFQGFFSKVPGSLQRWFLRLFVYAHASPIAAAVVKNILSMRDGPFSRKAFLVSDAGRRFLNHLAEADPSATLHVIESTFARWSADELRGWRDGRQDIVWALEKIAVWEDTFSRAARVLATLSISESDTHSNNSTGVLHGLFHVMAATQAPATARLSIIEEFLQSTDERYRSLGIALCESWLSTNSRMRIVGAEFQGMRPPIAFWSPKTYGEIWDLLLKGWAMLLKETRIWPDTERTNANRALVKSATGLLYIEKVAPVVVQSLFDLEKDPATDRAQLTKFLIGRLTLRQDRLKPSTMARLRQLERRVTGRSVASRIARYVLHTSWEEDRLERLTKSNGASKAVRERAKLVKELTSSPKIFASTVTMLVKSEGHKLYEFAHDIAIADSSPKTLRTVLSAQRSALAPLKTQFIGGYLRGLRERQANAAEQAVLTLLRVKATREVGVEIVLRGTVSDAIIKQLTRLFTKSEVGPNAFSRLGWQAAESNIPAETIEDVISALLTKRSAEAAEAAVEILETFYKEGMILPERLTYRVLTSPHVLKRDSSSMVGYHWQEIAKVFRSQHPKYDLMLFKQILSSTDELYGLYAGGYASAVASSIAQNHPVEAWDVIAEMLQNQKNKAYRVITWLSDTGFDENPRHGPIRYFPTDLILAWIKKAPKQRAHMIASCLPKTLRTEEGGEITRRFIEAYGQDDEMADHVIGHFWTGSWSGPESVYLGKKRDEARLWLGDTKNPAVRLWLERYVEYLTKRIQSAEIEEERRF